MLVVILRWQRLARFGHNLSSTNDTTIDRGMRRHRSRIMSFVKSFMIAFLQITGILIQSHVYLRSVLVVPLACSWTHLGLLLYGLPLMLTELRDGVRTVVSNDLSRQTKWKIYNKPARIS